PSFIANSTACRHLAMTPLLVHSQTRNPPTCFLFHRCRFHGIDRLAFTACVFADCNIDQLHPDEGRGLYVRDNSFDRPLTERRAEFEITLAQALAARKIKGK
ncbi:MAG: hypothetical protein ABI407_13070, partial [Bradyrhizobium sp.]